MNDTFVVLLLLVLIWYWWDSTWAKEIARRAGKKACVDADLQFLDDTVSMRKIRIRRNNLGRLVICRSYYFEFASHGDARYKGKINLFGKDVDEIQMQAYKI